MIGAVAYGFALEALAVVLLVALLVSAMARPSAAVFLCAFAIYTNSPMVLAGTTGFTSLTELLFGVLGAVAFIDWLKGRQRFNQAFLPLLTITLFFLTVVGSLLVSRHVDLTERGLTELGRFVLLGCAFLVVVNSRTRFTAAIAGVLVGAVFLSTLTIIQHVFDLKNEIFYGYARNHITYLFEQVDEVRFGGPVGEPNFYAQILLLAYPVALCLTLANLKFSRLIFAACAVLILTAVILTQSRGGMTSLAIVTVLAAVLLHFRARKILLALVPALAIVALLMTSAAGERIAIAIEDIRSVVTLEGNITDDAIAGRISQMLAAWHLFLENPWFGTGYDTFERLYQDTSRRFDLMARGEDRQAHSLILEVLAERGVTGFLVWCGFLLLALYSGLRGMREFGLRGHHFGEASCAGLVIALIGYLLTSIFLHEAFIWYFWLIIGLTLAAPIAARETASGSSGESHEYNHN